MLVSTIQPHVDPADVPAEQLASNKKLTEDQKLGEITRQFEAVLLRQILQETQKTAIPSEFTDNSTAAGIYQDMVTGQLADSISKSGTVGLAKMLQRQLTRQLHPVSQAGLSQAPGAQPTSLSGSGGARPLTSSERHALGGPKLHPLKATPHKTQ